MDWIKKNHRLLFYGVWLLLNLIQSAGTGLLDDEAYYWVYSKFPDWGYFDHPPMISLLIKGGYALFHNELGVRFFVAIMNVLTIYAIDLMLPRKDDRLFYLICFSMAILQIGGIIAVPDIPLTFFTAVFFLAYKRFLRDPSIVSSLLLGLVMALMLYSKYHGILIIIAVVISNPKLALKPAAYVAVATGIILFSPHLYWQYVNDFPSVQFHLFERNAPAYQLNFTTEYILGQIALAGPFAGWLLLFAAFFYKPVDLFERGLKYAMLGIYLFFLISTAKGRVEANWTVLAFIPLIILSHQYLLDHRKLANVLAKMLPFTIVLVLIARIYMLIDVQPLPFLKKDEFHKNQAWADSIHKKAGDHPVVFLSTYQRPSKYWFYSGQPAFSLNTINYRRNIFNFIPMEELLIGKSVAVVSSYNFGYYSDTIHTPRGLVGVNTVDSFYSFSKVKVTMPRKLFGKTGEPVIVELDIAADGSELELFQSELYSDLPVEIYVLNEGQPHQTLSSGLRLGDIKALRQHLKASFTGNFTPGKYTLRLGIPSAIPGEPALISSPISLEVR
jgi:hypothetical protein